MGSPGGSRSGVTVPAQGGVAPQGAVHLREGQRAHNDGTWARGMEAEPLVEGHQRVLAHERSLAHGQLASHVVQVAPEQDGALALPPEGAVHGQHVQVGGAPPGPVQCQRLLGQETTGVRVACVPSSARAGPRAAAPESLRSGPLLPKLGAMTPAPLWSPS